MQRHNALIPPGIGLPIGQVGDDACAEGGSSNAFWHVDVLRPIPCGAWKFAEALGWRGHPIGARGCERRRVDPTDASVMWHDRRCATFATDFGQQAGERILGVSPPIIRGDFKDRPGYVNLPVFDRHEPSLPRFYSGGHLGLGPGPL